MGRSNRSPTKSKTLPSSPTHSFTSSSSSSSFEFTVSRSPEKSSAAADELFYKGQLLPLHLSPRLSLVRTLLSSSSSSDTSSSRDSTASHSSTSSDSSADLLLCDSSRPSSAAADDEFTKRLPASDAADILSRKPSKYFSLSKLSFVFRKDNKNAAAHGGAAAVKRVSSTAREVLRKYLKKVKPLYEKLSHKQKMPPPATETAGRQMKQSFSGNLRYPVRRCHVSSCPSSMMSSPRHGESGFRFTQTGRVEFGSGSYNPDSSSMEELQNAIQGAIAHCKNSMMMNKVISNEI